MVEFVDPALVEEGDYPSMTIGDVEVPGIYDVTESGGGFTEKYKTEYADRAGGNDTADEPPAAQMTVRAVATDDTWEALNNLREQRDPFSVGIGEFTYAEMGIVDLQRTIDADNVDTNWIQIQLQEFREVTIAQAMVTVGAPENINTEGVSTMSNPSGDGGGSGSGSEGPQPGEGDPMDSPNDAPTGGGIEPVPAGGGEVITVGSGETFGGEGFDISANGADPTIDLQGPNATVANVGFQGNYDVHEALIAPHFTGSNLIENVYLGDGSVSAHTGPTGIWVHPSSNGELTIRHVNVQNFGDNGVYASAPGGSATTHIDQCYGQDCGIANFRFSRGTVQDTTSIMTSSYPHSHAGGAIWVWPPGPGEIRGSDLLAEAGNTNAVRAGEDSPATVDIYDSEVSGGYATHHDGAQINEQQGVGSNPDTSPPPIPRSAQQAVDGQME